MSPIGGCDVGFGFHCEITSVMTPSFPSSRPFLISLTDRASWQQQQTATAESDEHRSEQLPVATCFPGPERKPVLFPHKIACAPLLLLLSSIHSHLLHSPLSQAPPASSRRHLVPISTTPALLSFASSSAPKMKLVAIALGALAVSAAAMFHHEESVALDMPAGGLKARWECTSAVTVTVTETVCPVPTGQPSPPPAPTYPPAVPTPPVETPVVPPPGSSVAPPPESVPPPPPGTGQPPATGTPVSPPTSATSQPLTSSTAPPSYTTASMTVIPPPAKTSLPPAPPTNAAAALTMGGTQGTIVVGGIVLNAILAALF
ncbi:hypothetical protein M011DRAFT_18962 [Sporormia fimetaria CBS 119925]|uniref:Uncharacterized protein n=1 Tax=Sporormia fimetaria CBS 119925 TaxID=1340428 RepID=A0A6A6VNP0_9PLEO|nr:hypothetical protein M011DRAFT_18962 [Sporormia fimetaria CBS 119925]